MTEAEYPSLTSGTITPIVKLRWVRRDLAKKLGRYLNLRAAAKIRSLVSWGMESATIERLITNDTVAGESPRCSASFFRLMGFRAIRPAPSLPGFTFLVATLRSLAQGNRRSKRKDHGRTRFLLLTSAGKTYFIHCGTDVLTRFSGLLKRLLSEVRAHAVAGTKRDDS